MKKAGMPRFVRFFTVLYSLGLVTMALSAFETCLGERSKFASKIHKALSEIFYLLFSILFGFSSPLETLMRLTEPWWLVTTSWRRY